MADNDKDVLDLWQNQTAEGFRMTTEEIQMKVQKLDATLRVRTRGGYLVCAFLIVFFSLWSMIEHDPIFRLGAAAIIIAIAYVAFQVYQNRFRSAPASAIATTLLDHLRRQLERQRDFHRGRTFWSRILLLVPAGLLLFYGIARAHPEEIRIIRFEVATFVIIILASIPLNLWMAKKYQRQIEELDQQGEQA